jgi:hypothetical protein
MVSPGTAFGRAAWLLLAAASSIACGSDEPDTRTFFDVGGFCVKSDGGERLTFSVSVGPPEHCLDGCSGSETSCRATLTGKRIELRSLLEIRELPGVVECPGDCNRSTATCELEGLPPGDYQFGFFSRADTLTLPFEGSISLFDDRECDPDRPVRPNPFPPRPPETGPVPQFESGGE